MLSNADGVLAYRVDFGLPDDHSAPCWVVLGCTESGFEGILLWGFARSKDADLAMRTMKEIKEIDWQAPAADFRKSFHGYGRENAMKFVCERLQW